MRYCWKSRSGRVSGRMMRWTELLLSMLPIDLGYCPRSLVMAEVVQKAVRMLVVLALLLADFDWVRQLQQLHKRS